MRLLLVIRQKFVALPKENNFPFIYQKYSILYSDCIAISKRAQLFSMKVYVYVLNFFLFINYRHFITSKVNS